MPVFGLRYQKFPGTTKRYLVIAVTANAIHEFVGDVEDSQDPDSFSFAPLFHFYDGNTGKYNQITHPSASYQDIPGDIDFSELHCWSEFLESSTYPSIPKCFAWLTGKY